MRARVILTVLAGMRVAAAQPVSDVKPLFDEGLALLAAKQPAEACAKFTAAIALEPDEVGLMLNLGVCSAQLDHVATALMWFRRAQTAAATRGQTASQTAAEEQIATLAPKVAALKITAPAGVITLDGAPIDASDRIEVDAGHHVIEVAGSRRELDIADGELQPIVIEEPRKVVIAPPPKLAIEPPRCVGAACDPGAAQRHRAYVIGGIGAGLLVGDLALGLIARHYYDATEHPGVQADWRNAVRYGGTSLFLLGGAAVATAVWLYVKAPNKEHIVIAPAGGRDNLGIAVSAWW